MNFLPASLRALIEELSRLPGIGPKSAQRLAFYLLKRGDAPNEALGKAVLHLKEGVERCQRCFCLSESTLCSICENPSRDEDLLCVVENTLDLLALEKTGEYRGYYHVLQGKLSPLEGVGPSDIRIAELLSRLTEEGNTFREVILALNPDLEGDTTALFLQRKLEPFGAFRVSRIARGIPSGGNLEYTDEHTLVRALEGRQILLSKEGEPR